MYIEMSRDESETCFAKIYYINCFTIKDIWYMFIHHQEDKNEEHHEICTSCQSWKVPHWQRYSTILIFVFFNSCKVSSLFVDIPEDRGSKQMSDVFHLLFVWENRWNSTAEFNIIRQLWYYMITCFVDLVIGRHLRDFQKLIKVFLTI